MKNDIHNIDDDEIRILGLNDEEERRRKEEPGRRRNEEETVHYFESLTPLYPEVDIAQLKKVIQLNERKKHNRWWILAITIVSIIAIGAIVTAIYLYTPHQRTARPLVYEEEEFQIQGAVTDSIADSLIQVVPTKPQGYAIVKDTIVNNIPLKIFIPRNAVPELVMGNINKTDSSIILGAMAADFGPDKRKGWIVAGGFILKGELISRSKSKYGFCAINDGEITLGNALKTELFEKCITDSGDFFRQYPLVENRIPLYSRKRNRTICRALCERAGEFIVVESLTTERFTDFANALAQLDIDNAITLMCSSMSVRWAIDKQGRRYETGAMEQEFPEVVNFIVWRSK